MLDIDVKAYFDSIDWKLMLKAVRYHTDCPWVLLYIERWLKVPVQMEDGGIEPRFAGGTVKIDLWAEGESLNIMISNPLPEVTQKSQTKGNQIAQDVVST